MSGKYLLGNFFEEYIVAERMDIIAAANAEFEELNIVSPAFVRRDIFRGTINDKRFMIHQMGDGSIFACSLFFRINDLLFSVLMPLITNADQAKVYDDFSKSKPKYSTVRIAQYMPNGDGNKHTEEHIAVSAKSFGINMNMQPNEIRLIYL